MAWTCARGPFHRATIGGRCRLAVEADRFEIRHGHIRGQEDAPPADPSTGWRRRGVAASVTPGGSLLEENMSTSIEAPDPGADGFGL